MAQKLTREQTLARKHDRRVKSVRVTAQLDLDALAREIYAAQRVAGVTR